MSVSSGSIGGKGVVFEVCDDCLRWRDLQTEIQTSIHADDIVCILPKFTNRDGSYIVIFIERYIKTDESGLEKEYPRLATFHASNLPSTLLSRYMCRHIPCHLKRSCSNVHVIISTLSGTGKGKAFFEDVLKPFLSHMPEVDYQVHETTSDQTIVELSRTIFLPQARNGIPQTIILLSGDGGLVDIIGAFFTEQEETAVFTPPSIALIPTGTGNAMANSIGLLSRSTFGLVALLRGRPQPLPTFVATFSPGAKYITDEGRGRESINTVSASYPKIHGAVVASWGMHAALVADSDTAEYRKYGADRFKMAAKELLYPSSGAETHKYKGRIKLIKLDSRTGKEDTQMVDRTEHMYVLATLVSKLEKEFTISPASAPLDGRLRAVHFGPMPPDEAMNLMALAYQGGRHVHHESVGYEEIEGIRIEFDEEDEKWRRVCIDGKIVAVEQGGWVEVRRERRRPLNLIACVH
ncbi:ATP-NAD kinase-like domain-containing protein [Thermoascus aurantiacus ATCC 26904]